MRSTKICLRIPDVQIDSLVSPTALKIHETKRENIVPVFSFPLAAEATVTAARMETGAAAGAAGVAGAEARTGVVGVGGEEVEAGAEAGGAAARADPGAMNGLGKKPPGRLGPGANRRKKWRKR